MSGPRPVALVTGASRGIARGAAIALGDAGFHVYLTGRTVNEGEAVVPLSGSLASTAAAVEAAGGRATAIRCDHGDDEAVRAVVERIASEVGRVDVLVNGVWGGYERFVADAPPNFGPYWEQPLRLWDSMHVTGLRSSYVASTLCTPLMLERGGLIVFLSSFAARNFVAPVAYGVAHSGFDRMAADMARELDDRPVTIVALYPGIVRTENVLKNAEYVDLSNSESPEFVGRAVAALHDDPDRKRHTGKALVVAELAEEYGFTDVDGTQPRSLRNGLTGP